MVIIPISFVGTIKRYHFDPHIQLDRRYLGGMKMRWFSLFLVMFTSILLAWAAQPVASAFAGSRKSITMQISFECVKFNGDCGKVRIIKPPSSQATLWLSSSRTSAAKALKGEEVKDGIFQLAPGELIFVKIAYVNDSDKVVQFRAIPHAIQPKEVQNLALYNCMCLGETYRVPPGKAWYRVIRVGAAEDMPPGTRFIATHILTSEGAVWWAK